MQTAGILSIWYAQLLNGFGAYNGQHILILIYHSIETVNVLVAMEATSTLNIAHMTSTSLSQIHFAKRLRVIYSIKITGVYSQRIAQ